MNHKLLSAFMAVLLSVEAQGMDDFFGFDGSQKDPLEIIEGAVSAVAGGLTAVVGGMSCVVSGVYNALPSSARVQDAALKTVALAQTYAVTPAGDVFKAGYEITGAGITRLNRKVDATVIRWELEEEFLDGIAAITVKDRPKTKLGEEGWEDVVISTRKPSGSESDDDDFGDGASSEDLHTSGELQTQDTELPLLPKPPAKDANPFGDD